jgi:hypothetical protein
MKRKAAGERKIKFHTKDGKAVSFTAKRSPKKNN